MRYWTVTINQYADAFPYLTKADVKRLTKFGALKVIEQESFRAYGKYLHNDIYSLQQFLTMTDADMKQLLEKFPKGMKMKGDDFQSCNM